MRHPLEGTGIPPTTYTGRAISFLRTSHLVKACILGFITFGVLAATLAITARWTDPPPGPGLSREPIFADYAVPVSKVGTQGSITSYEAQTAFWRLLPDTWRNSADWRISFSKDAAQPQGIYVGGVQIQLRESTNPGEPPFYYVPSRLIGTTTKVTVDEFGASDPNFYLHWNRSYIFPTVPLTSVSSALVQLDGSAVPVRLNGAQLDRCQLGYSSAIPFVKGCRQSNEVLTIMASGRADSTVPGAWPTSQGAISFWVRPAASGHYCLLTNDDFATRNLSLNITLDGPGAILVFVSSDGVSRKVLVGQHHVPMGLWSHIGVSLSDEYITLYVNGEFDSRLRLRTPIHPSPHPLVLGSDVVPGRDYVYSFDGQITDVRLSSRTLGPDEMLLAYTLDAVKNPQGYELGDPRLDTLRATPSSHPWWQTHLILALAISVAYLLAFGFLLAWCLGQIRVTLRSRTTVTALVASFAGLIIASLFTTTFDLQLFKGLGEGYWVNGPLPALTISGYGPIADLLFTVPMLPYAMLVPLLGAHSEVALNLAIRLPFVLGWLFLIASAARLMRSVDRNPASNFPWLLLLLNPLGLVITLWQPEALLAGLVALSLALLFEGRPMAAGMLLAVAFAGKYWPAVIGPIVLIAAWRLSGRGAGLRFLATAALTAVGVFILYWLPTALLLNSLSELAALAITRMPYFGGSHAARVASLWSLYAVPEKLLPGPLSNAVSVIEQYALIVFLIVYVGLVAMCLREGLRPRHVLLASAGALVLLAGISSFSVPQFGLWSVPLVLVAGAVGARGRRRLGLRQPPAFVWLTVAATWCAIGASFFVEPLSYFLLHMSPSWDDFAHSTGAWLLSHVVSPSFAQLLGFWFALLLVLAGVFIVAGLFGMKSLPTTGGNVPFSGRSV